MIWSPRAVGYAGNRQVGQGRPRQPPASWLQFAFAFAFASLVLCATADAVRIDRMTPAGATRSERLSVVIEGGGLQDATQVLLFVRA
jgi:hypothetical protein